MNKKLSQGEKLMIASGVLTLVVVGWIDAVYVKLDLVRLLGYGVFIVLFLFTVLELDRARPTQLQYLALAFQIVIFSILFIHLPSHLVLILLVVWAAVLPEYFPAHSWQVLIAVNAALIAVNQLLISEALDMGSIAMIIGLQIFAAASSNTKRDARISEEKLEMKNLELRATQSLLTRQSQVKERMRIARDLHDSIGHKLTVLSLQLEHAKHQPPSALDEWLENLASEVKETLNQLRHIVREMRSTESVSLSAIIKDIERALTDSVEIDCPDSLQIGDPELGEQLVFCLQEAISNALRHGRASKISIAKIGDSPLILQIQDNGSGARKWQQGSGLLGMKERLRPFGGKVSLAPGVRRGMVLSIFVEVSEYA